MSNTVVVCSWAGDDGRMVVGTEETLGLGHRTASALGAALHWLILGAASEEVLETAGRLGVSGVDVIEDPALAGSAQDACVEALAQYVRLESPALLLFAQTPQARVVAPRLAGRVGAGVLMNAVEVAVAEAGRLEVTAAAYGGDTRMVYELSGAPLHLIALQTTALPVASGEEGTTKPERRSIPVDLSQVRERVRVIEEPRAEGPRLEEAEIVVAGGRGLGSPEGYALIEQLAKALGALPAASRPLVDEGWVDSARQVGLTGKITRPALYLAAGISGASQHMAGCSAAKTLVAINRDPDAPIFRYCRYGLVGDCLEILPELIRAVQREGATA